MHASGIRVDDQATADFTAASNDASCLFLRFQIQGEKFVQRGRGSTKEDLKANFAEIQRALKEAPNDPSYIVSKNISKEPNKWLLMFYMPEGCTVRDRMVYASSASALKEGLGGSNFDAATFNFSKITECNADDYESVSRSLSQDDLLTLDEKLKLEGEAESAKSMSSTRARAIVGLPIKASEESLDQLALVQKGQPNTVILSLNPESEILQVQQAGNFTWEQVATKLPLNEPRYVLQNFSHEHGGKSASAFVFIYYCPEDIKPKLKMFYSTCKQVVTKLCETLGINISKSIELSALKEISTEAVLEDLYPPVAVKTTFKKPSRPGRGNARLIGEGGASASPPASSPSASSASPQ